MREIPLTQGKFALVDDDDFEWLIRFNWQAVLLKGKWYARRIGTRPRRETIYMHREIAGVSSDTKVDHENGNGLDNRRWNLRPATSSENQMNKGMSSNNSTGYKGVSWHKGNGKYIANIKVGEKRIHLGYFDTPEQAALAYDVAAEKYFGRFAHLNSHAQGR